MNKRLTHSTRISLLHVKHKWPSIITSALWPFCDKAAEERDNKLDVDEEGGFPWERLLGIGPPNWDPQSKASVYLGYSLHHAGNVALVLNAQTGHVRLQYHLVFDDEFTTVPYIDSTETPPNWATLVAEHSERTTDEAFTIAST
eukprot:13100788-Ditylum_brightwellii.AAC.1